MGLVIFHGALMAYQVWVYTLIKRRVGRANAVQFACMVFQALLLAAYITMYLKGHLND